jgi:hypothetical protein
MTTFMGSLVGNKGLVMSVRTGYLPVIKPARDGLQTEALA